MKINIIIPNCLFLLFEGPTKSKQECIYSIAYRGIPSGLKVISDNNPSNRQK